jgi:hypothetical protein
MKALIESILIKLFDLQKKVVPEGYTPINETLPEDVFLVAYPKSGITWFQNLVSGLAYGANPKMTPWLLVGDMVPDVHASKFYRRYTTPMFFKSHFLPQPQYRRVIYLLRDGRDAMVSYLHYENSLKGKKLDFLDFVTAEGNLFPCKWHRHVETWMQNPYKAEMLVIKYEDLLEDTVGQLENICKFARLPGDPDMLAFVAESARFNYLQNKEAKHQKYRPEKWADDKLFFRRGEAGSHRDEMPPKVLEAFLSDASETLRRHGYRVEPAGAGVTLAAAER